MKHDILLALLVGAVGVTAARGDVTAFRGSVLATVQERIDGQASSFNDASDDYALSDQPVLIDAAIELASADLDGFLSGAAVSHSLLDDPRLATGPNPAEYGLEVSCFSNAARKAYTATAKATEVRRVLFGPAVPGLPTVFQAAPGQQVESSIFVGGTFLFWSTQPAGSLAQTRAEMSVTVRDSRRLSLNPTLFSIRLAFEGDEDGQVSGSVTSDRLDLRPSIQFEILDLPALREAAETDDAAQALVDEADELGLDTVVAVFIPLQRMRYTYDLDLNFAFDLIADFELSVSNAPSGSGVGAVMGRPFDSLAQTLRQSVTGIDGRLIQDSINKLAAKVSVDPSQAVFATGGPTSEAILCGSIGPVSLSLLGLGLLSFCRLGRSRVASRELQLARTYRISREHIERSNDRRARPKPLRRARNRAN